MSDEIALRVASLMQAFKDIGYDARGALMAVRDPEALPQFVEALRSNDVALQTAGAEWLRGLKDERIRPQLEALLEDADVRVRYTAVDAYAELPAGPLAPLLARLQDDDNDVRWNAVDAISRLAERLPPDAVLAHLDDARPRVRGVLARVLGKMHPREAVPALRRLAQDPHPKVRWWAEVALEEAGPARLDYHGPLEGHVGFAPPPEHEGF